jgi:hypothetical protein
MSAAEEADRPGVLAQAATFARAGITIFPTRNKKPMPGYLWKERASNRVNHVIEDFTLAIELWGEDFVEISWACGLDQCLVIDLETKDRQRWEDWQNDLFDQAVVNETIKGFHLGFRWPDGVEPGNGVPKALKAAASEPFDIRGSGGYSVVFGPGRRGMNPDDLSKLVEYPHPEHLMPYGGGAQPVNSAAVVAFANEHNTASNLNMLHGIQEAIAQYDSTKNGQPGGRHDYCHWLLCCAAEDAQRGYYPFTAALNIIKPWMLAMIGNDQARLAQFHNTREWEGMLRWAVGNALAKAESVPTDGTDEGESPDLLGDNSSVPRLIREAIDWNEFWNADTTIATWLIDGFWPLGKKVGVYAKQSEGKSEWALWCALQVVTGLDPGTGERLSEPAPVLYLDYEMDWDDLRDRLESYGVQGGLDLLTYDQFPTTGGVDTDAGRQAILEAVDYLGARAVIIDTYGMAIEGPENDADTALKVARDLGNPLKSRGVGMLLIVHPGRDVERGARGSSALAQQMDVMWMLNREPGSTHSTLSCTGPGRKRRQSWVPARLVLDRSVTDDGTVRYSREREIAELVMSPAITALVAELEDAGIDPTMTQRETQEALGRKPKTKNLAAAMRYRKEFYERYPQGKIGGSSHLSTGNQGVGDDDGDDT